jgi:succinate dehydrogenase / fumarate reductase flavoprotein subunit
MGGIEVDPDTGAAATLACSPPVSAPAVCTAQPARRQPLSDLLVFGRRAGRRPRTTSARCRVGRPCPRSRRRRGELALAPFKARGRPAGERLHPARRTAADDERPGRHHPHLAEIQEALDKIEEYKARYRNIEADGKRPFNPRLAPGHRHAQHAAGQRVRGWARTESRGGHTRDDYPAMDAEWRRTLLARRPRMTSDPEITVTKEVQPPMRTGSARAFDREPGAAFTDEELAQHPGRRNQ